MAVDDETRKLVRVTQRGQATLPKEWRDRLGIDAPDDVVMIAVDDGIVVKPLRSLDELAGRHGGEFEDGGAMARVEQWRAADAEDERADERLHGLETGAESDS
jgi:AbrB family looped-hinge helix DNA binding protein